MMPTPIVLVLAGNSFLGRHLRELMTSAGYQVAWTSRTSGLRCDLTQPEDIAAVLQQVQPDWIIQCAGVVPTRDQTLLTQVHVQGSLLLLATVARHVPHAQVLLVGSAAEYGIVPQEHLPVTEDYSCQPGTPFGVSKLTQTRLAATFTREHSLRVTTVRPFNVIGPGQPEHYLAAALAKRLRDLADSGGPCTFPVTNLTATRDFIDVRDVSLAILRLLDQLTCVTGRMALYNIATGIETSVKSVALLLGQLAGGFLPIDAGNQASRGDILRSCGDASRLTQATGWRPRWTWQESISALWSKHSSSIQPHLPDPLKLPCAEE